MMAALAYAAALASVASATLTAGCAGDARTSLFIEVLRGPGTPPDPEALRIFLVDGMGTRLFDDRRLPEEGRLQPLSADRIGTFVLFLGNASGRLELNVFATKDGARVGRGRVEVEATAGKQGTATVTVMPTESWPDSDQLLGLGPNGEPCGTDEQCLSGACVDGVCCGHKLCRTCEACNQRGSAGTCTPIAAGLADDFPVAACSGANACDGERSCRGALGQACASPSDCASGFCAAGVCCSQACEGVCQSCGEVGGSGLCRGRAVGAQPAEPGCPGEGLCDGTGACRPPCMSRADCESGSTCMNGVCMPLLADGDECEGGSACASGLCADGRCCKASCGTCMACTGAGGTCQPRQPAEQDQMCSGSSACNGKGGCGRANGQRCESAGQCASGQCAGGVCCDQACQGPCRNCARGMCLPLVNVADPRGCSGSHMCDGTGQCRKTNGERCEIDAECASGQCVDGACCNSACNESCYSCGTGVCTLRVNTFDAQCTGGRRCDASGLCR